MRLIAQSLCILIGFSGYLRPRELTMLKVGQLIAPVKGSAKMRHWALVLHPSEGDVRSKGGMFDESV
eukprot:7487371-Karenia_brevis.AAC.1